MKIKLSLVSILIGSMALPACAAEGVKAAPPHVVGQPVASTPETSQPIANVQVTEPSVAAPVVAQPDTITSGSANTQPSPPAVTNKSRLTFMDSKLFDVKLGKELESGKDTVEVNVSGRVPLSNIPGRIDRWMVKSAEEGKVELLQSEPAPKTRFIFSLIPMVFNAVGFMKNVHEDQLFDHAKNYDTKIYYKKDDSGDTLIEKIVMTKRKP